VTAYTQAQDTTPTVIPLHTRGRKARAASYLRDFRERVTGVKPATLCLASAAIPGTSPSEPNCTQGFSRVLGGRVARWQIGATKGFFREG